MIHTTPIRKLRLPLWLACALFAIASAPVYSDGPPAPPPPEAAELAAEFPQGTFLLATERFLIVHDTAYVWADNRARLLDRAYDEFYKSMTAAGFAPKAPDKRLICVIFDKFESFAQYAQETDRRNVDWAGGYYSGRTNRIALYNYHNSPKLKGLATQINQLQSSIQAAEAQLASAKWRRDPQAQQNAKSDIATAQRRLMQVRSRYEAGGGLSNIANTFHEAAHMLAFNSGIQTPGHTYPLWFSEGIATAFETIAPASPLGPGKPNRLRQPALIKAIQNNTLLPIDDLIAVTDISEDDNDEQRRSLLYAQSWGLFCYLVDQRREDLVRYAKALNDLPPGPRPTAQLRQIFTDAFGPTDQLQQAMITYHLARK